MSQTDSTATSQAPSLCDGKLTTKSAGDAEIVARAERHQRDCNRFEVDLIGYQLFNQPYSAAVAPACDAVDVDRIGCVILVYIQSSGTTAALLACAPVELPDR